MHSVSVKEPVTVLQDLKTGVVSVFNRNCFLLVVSGTNAVFCFLGEYLSSICIYKQYILKKKGFLHCCLIVCGFFSPSPLFTSFSGVRKDSCSFSASYSFLPWHGK